MAKTTTTGTAANVTVSAATTGPVAVNADYVTDIDAAATTTAYPAWLSTCATVSAATTTVPSRPSGLGPAAPPPPLQVIQGPGNHHAELPAPQAQAQGMLQQPYQVPQTPQPGLYPVQNMPAQNQAYGFYQAQ